MADDDEQSRSAATVPDPATSTAPAHGDASLAAKAWRPAAIVVSGLLALLVSLLLLAGDLLAGVLTNLGGGPPAAGTFLGIAAAGHGVLALASALLFGIGLANARRRRPAVLASWAIIGVGVGWFFLWGRLAAA